MSLGQRLRLSRRAEGLSLRDLASRIDNQITAQAISKYERGVSMPSSGVLIALANALGTSVDYLSGACDVSLETVDFRTSRFASQKEEDQVEARILDLLERYLTVEEILGLATVNRNLPSDSPWPLLRDAAEAEQAALALRCQWSLGLEPIPNLVELLEKRGIKILAMPLSNIDGLTAGVVRKDRSIASVIVVNRRNRGESQRFAVARELGQLVLNVPPKVDDEKAAHRFAGAFLMPAELLRSEIGKHRQSIGWGELFDLKRVFGVSVQALTYRCRDLEIFGNLLFRQLLNEFNRRGWRSPPYSEPWAMDGEQPKRFERLCFRAVSEGAISESRAAELLGCSVDQLVRHIDDPPNMETAPTGS